VPKGYVDRGIRWDACVTVYRPEPAGMSTRAAPWRWPERAGWRHPRGPRHRARERPRCGVSPQTSVGGLCASPPAPGATHGDVATRGKCLRRHRHPMNQCTGYPDLAGLVVTFALHSTYQRSRVSKGFTALGIPLLDFHAHLFALPLHYRNPLHLN
jgi:hypothetical protein